MSSDLSPQKEFLSVVSGSTYLAEQEGALRSQRKRIAWPTFILVLLTVGIFCTQLVVYLFQGVTLIPLWANLLLLGGIVSIDRWLIPFLEGIANRETNYTTGRRGEAAMAMFLQEHLSAEWTLYQNLVLPDRADDIDAVLLGPSCIYALEVKTFSGKYRNRGKSWQRWDKGRWFEISKNPTRQALGNAVRLHKALKEAGCELRVEPRVVWAGSQGVSFVRPAVPIWQLSTPGFIVRELSQTEKLSTKEKAKIGLLLKEWTKASASG